MLYQDTFLNKSLILFNPPFRAKTERKNLYKEGSYFCVCATQKRGLFYHFHNPHFHNLVHCQDLSYSLYAQPLKQAQENYRTYTPKDNLS